MMYLLPMSTALAACLFLSYVITPTTTAPSSFQCPEAGVYPDPTDCHNFYICDNSLVPNKGTCMSGNGTYDAESKVCRVTPCSGAPEPAVTVKPAFTCTTVGVFADPTDCHNFYTCGENLTPFLGICMKGAGSFDPVNQVCSADPCSVPGYKCVSDGFFADPQDCHGFYVCDENLKATHSTCTDVAHFDPQRICVVGKCVT